MPMTTWLRPGRRFEPRRVSAATRTRRTAGQTMVEFALAFPIFFGLLMGAIQLGLVLIWYGDEVRLTRDATRWLAVHAETSQDGDVAAQVRLMLMPTMIGGPPSGSVQNDTPGDHSQAVAVYRIGNLLASFTPCLPDQASPPHCTNPDRSSDGGTVHVDLSYDAANIFFMPTRLDLPFMLLQMPTTLPSYRAWMTTE